MLSGLRQKRDTLVYFAQNLTKQWSYDNQFIIFLIACWHENIFWVPEERLAITKQANAFQFQPELIGHHSAPPEFIIVRNVVAAR